MHVFLFLLHLTTENIFVSSNKGNCISFVGRAFWFISSTKNFHQNNEALMTVLRQMGRESTNYTNNILLVSKTKMEVESRAILTNLDFIMND